jgi:hypothetical protein
MHITCINLIWGEKPIFIVGERHHVIVFHCQSGLHKPTTKVAGISQSQLHRSLSVGKALGGIYLVKYSQYFRYFTSGSITIF